MNREIKKPHERALRVTHEDNSDEILEKDKSITTDKHNLRALPY